MTQQVSLFEQLDWLRSLKEASRVLSADNLEIVKKIKGLVGKMPHHPASSEIDTLIDELIGRHEASPSMQQEAAGESPVTESLVDEAGWLIEARADGTGKRWAAVGIKSGTSINGRYWGPNIIESPAFLAMSDGADVFEDHDPPEEREKYPVRRVGDLIGSFDNPTAKRVGTDAAGDPIVEMHAEFVVIDPAWQAKLKAADEAGKLDRFTFSINALGETVQERRGGQLVEAVQSVTAIRSYDLVTKASAGGRIDRMLEHAATQEDSMPDETPTGVVSVDMDALTTAITQGVAAALAAQQPAVEAAAPDPAPAPDLEPDLAELDSTETAATEALPPMVKCPECGMKTPEGAKDGKCKHCGASVKSDKVAEAVARAERAAAEYERRVGALTSQDLITRGLAESHLPGVVREAAEKRLNALATRRSLTEADVAAMVEEYRPLGAAVAHQSPLAEARVGDMRSFHEHYQNRMVAMLSTAVRTGMDVPKEKDGTPYQPFTSLREAWWTWNQGQGNPFDSSVSTSIMDALNTRKYSSSRDHSRIQESITTSDWAQIVQDSMYLMLLKHYSFAGYDDWSKIVSTIETAADFRTRHWMRVGGYGDLPTVGEGAAYQPSTSPGDEEVTYSVSKRGMLEDQITLEMVANDSVGALARIPQELANSAKRTLYKFVFDMVTGQNPTMGYDSIALYHTSSHGPNSGTAALSVSGLEAGAVAMESQPARLAADETLGERNYPRFLITSRTGRARAKRILDPSDAYAYGLTPAATTPGANIDTDPNIDPHQFKGTAIENLVYQYAAISGTYAWTNLRDWYLVADPTKVDTVIVGFFAGRREPELFMQDDPNSGLGWSNDTHALKVRHIYGGVVANHTSFRREISAT